MKRIFKLIPVIIVIIIICFVTSANTLIIATDTSEGTPGVDMAATYNITDGFHWIYPGSSFNAQGQILHNIYLDTADNPYQGAVAIMEHTYNFKPNIIITINNEASERIFGGDIVSNIRDYDWGQGMDRGIAVEHAMSDFKINYFGIIQSIFTGDIGFHFI